MDKTQFGELVQRIDAFLGPSGDRSIASANRIEVALDDLLGEDPEFADYVETLALYRPEGGEFLIGERELEAKLVHLRRLLVSMLAEP
jgi:hypothetical protein